MKALTWQGKEKVRTRGGLIWAAGEAASQGGRAQVLELQLVYTGGKHVPLTHSPNRRWPCALQLIQLPIPFCSSHIRTFPHQSNTIHMRGEKAGMDQATGFGCHWRVCRNAPAVAPADSSCAALKTATSRSRCTTCRCPT
jgi:hypothetical protein